LKNNVELNALDQVTPVHAGVGATSAKAVRMQLPCGYRLDGRNTATWQQIRVWAIDDYFKDKRVDFMKIDTDGWELDVLNGAKEVLKLHHPKILFEFSPWHLQRSGSDPQSLFAYLEEAGYRISYEDGSPVRSLDHALASVQSRGGGFNLCAE
jgi:hypothetical protein